MGKQRIAYSEAMAIAELIIERLHSACERIEIAGSLRRGNAEVGDIEIVAIPKPVLNLFGEPTERTEIDIALGQWGISLAKNGPKYKQFTLGSTQIDLFLATEDNWGLIYMLRTGSPEFSKRMVTPAAWGGYLPAGLKVDNGRVWYSGAALTVPEETELFELWGMPYVDPIARYS